MSEKKINAAFRLMIIDIEEDRIVLDEFCDVALGGYARNSENGKSCADVKGICVAKCNVMTGLGASMAAEKIIEKHKKNVIAGLLVDVSGGDLESAIDEIFGGDDGAET